MSRYTKTIVEILNNSGVKIAIVNNLYPINEEGTVLTYSSELSDYGTCRFRIATPDPMLTQYGDITVPHQYQVRIVREGTVVWRGVIVDNPERNQRYIEVVAHEYLWYLSKILIRRDEELFDGDGKKHLKTFKSGTMKTVVTSLFNQAKADLGNSPISGASVGSVDTIQFPDSYSETGQWTFSDIFALQFDYHDALYVLKTFGIYSEADFELDNDLVFRFKKQIGKQLFKVSFEYGQYGNMVDYNIPRFGKRMVNDLHSIAAITDDLGFASELLHINKTDEASIKKYGKLEAATSFNDVKNKSTLKQRAIEELRLISEPEAGPINLVLNEKGIPFGQYNVGDIVKVKIKDHNINFNDWRRIVGMTVSLHNTGREITVVQTNKPTKNMLEIE